MGYDAGLYVRILKTFPQIPEWLKMGFSPGLFLLSWPITKLNINPETTVIWLKMGAGLFLFGCLYWVVKKLTDKKTALLTVFLLTISAVQYRTFWYFYVKNIFGLGFLVLSSYFLSKKDLIKSLVFSFITAVFHLPTFLNH